ncbi:MAG: hypothetical protein JW753_03780 [Dehalococcoidia bacterium]|nr:hypothetical protein [Dehalococcoidia bacterium]
MRIAEFENAFRAALATDSMLLASATPAYGSQAIVELPSEFAAAMDSLASRAGDQPKETSLLRTIAAQWS